MFCGRGEPTREVSNFFPGLFKLAITALLIFCWNKDPSKCRTFLFLRSPGGTPQERALVYFSMGRRQGGRMSQWI